MVDYNNEVEIRRAWILVETNSDTVDAVASGIYALNASLDDKKKQFVRSDTVDGPYQIVVPIFAPDDTGLNDLQDMIYKKYGVSSIMLKVKKNTHTPDPPHTAEGYVTEEENNKVENPGGKGTTGWNTWG